MVPRIIVTPGLAEELDELVEAELDDASVDFARVEDADREAKDTDVVDIAMLLDEDTAVVVTLEELSDVSLPPKISFAASVFVHPTYTPTVPFIGSAKQLSPEGQTSMTKLPAALQFPVFPAMQAIWPAVHDEEKFRVEKRELYDWAEARLDADAAGERELDVVGGGRTVGM